MSVTFISLPARAQLTRLDSVLAFTASAHLLTIDPAVTVNGDSVLKPIVGLMHSIPSGHSTFTVHQLTGIVQAEAGKPRMHVLLAGSLQRPGEIAQPIQSWTGDVDVELTQTDRRDLETNASRYVHLERTEATKTFWDSFVAPALIVIGSGLIVALFFLIRS